MLFGRQIEAFRAVMLTGGMTAAAELLYITQPAVSRLIKDLELELKLKLFNRRGNQVSPTADALELYAEVERSFIGFERLRMKADDLRTGRTGSLRVAALPAMAMSFLPRFVASFCRERPDLRVMVDGIPSHLVLERVAGGQFDIGISALTNERPSLDSTLINSGTVVVLPVGHALTAKSLITAEDLANESLIMLSSGSYGRHSIEMALGSIPRRQLIETPLSAIACVMVAEGMGITIVDPFSASDFVGRGVVLRQFHRDVPENWSVVVKAGDRPLSRIAAEFEAALLAHIDDFLTRQDYLRDP